MDRVRRQVGCPEEIMEYSEGTSVGVAVLDSGISAHPDFKGRIAAFHDFVNGKNGLYDDSGHGTHVAGCIGGDGMISQGKYRGIHPGCRFIIGKVLNYNGDGNLQDMLRGMRWVLKNAADFRIRVLNISVGINNIMEQELLEEVIGLIETAWSRGITVVCAAGNSGPRPMTISPLGVGKHVITVGCHDGGYFGNRQNLCEYYSGRGPSPYAIKKPDIVAPGTDITCCNYKCKRRNRLYYNAYTMKSGTSMATPVVTGAIALLIQKYGALGCEEVKRRLVYSATDLDEPWTKQGWGMLNIRRLLE